MMKIKFLVLLILLCPLKFVSAQDTGYTVSGKIIFTGEGKLYILLTDEESSKIPFEGIRKAVIDTAKEAGDDSRCADFCFTEIPAGIYGIRCFQDENGNEKLDSGLFGPSEPWGMSWSGKKRMPPDFEDYSFRLDSDLVMGDIILNK